MDRVLNWLQELVGIFPRNRLWLLLKATVGFRGAAGARCCCRWVSLLLLPPPPFLPLSFHSPLLSFLPPPPQYSLYLSP